MKEATIDIVAKHLVTMSGDEPAKVFAFQEVMELKFLESLKQCTKVGKMGQDVEDALQRALDKKHKCTKCYVPVQSASMWAQRMVVFAKSTWVHNSNVEVRHLYHWKPSSFAPGRKGCVALHIAMTSPQDPQNTASALVLNVHLPSEDGQDADISRADMFKNIQAYYTTYKPWGMFSTAENFFYDVDGVTKKTVVVVGDFNARLNFDKKSKHDMKVLKNQLNNAKGILHIPDMKDIPDIEIDGVRLHGSIFKRRHAAYIANLDYSEKLFSEHDNFFKAMTGAHGGYHPTSKSLFGKTEHHFGGDFIEKPKQFMPTYKIQHDKKKVKADLKALVAKNKELDEKIQKILFNVTDKVGKGTLQKGVDNLREQISKMTNYTQTNVDGVKLTYYAVKDAKKCMPGWTDRVFVRGHKKTVNDILNYKSDPTLKASDHSPVSAVIKL